MAVVLITGCSSGFGEAIARGFVARGDQVMATMRRPEAAPASLRALADANAGRVKMAPLDVVAAASRAQAIESTLRAFGRLDVLVNNAGVGAAGSAEDTPESLWRSVMEINFFGPLELMRLALPVMRVQRAGRIINVTSVASVLATPMMGAYCASKHALDCTSTAMDIETRSFGVRVVTVMPGPFKTRLPASSAEAPVSAAYAGIAAKFKATFGELEQHAAVDLQPVVNAALAAATDAEPRQRYVAGAEGLKLLPPILQALEPLEKFGLHITGQLGPAH